MNDNRRLCQYRWTGPNSGEQSKVQARRCYREVWGDHDRCIWHAEIDDEADKPIEELLKQLHTPQGEGKRSCELLDGAQLSGLFANIRLWSLVDYEPLSEVSDDLRLLDIIKNSQLLGNEFDSKLSFNCCSLRDADLSEANLFISDFSNANLKYADFSGACLRGADLSDAKLQHANFSGADLRYANLSESILQHANFSGANLRYADLSGADLQCVNFRDAKLCGPETTLENIDLSEADLRDADLSGADLRCANLQDAKLCNSRAILQRAVFSEANLRDVDLSGAYLRGADLSDAKLQHADLSGADLKRANLSKTKLFDADFSEANLYDANLSEADLRDTDFLEADLRDTDFSEADLRGADFSEADLRGAIFKDLGDINMNIPTLFPQRRGSYENTVNSSFDCNQIARSCHNIAEECSERGLTKEAREITISERRARRKEARADSDWFAWTKSWIAWQTSGYGISVKQVLRNMVIVFGMGLFVYLAFTPRGLAFIPLDRKKEFESIVEALYFSTITFTTTPPNNPDTDLVKIIAMGQAFMGTLLVVLLGYVLGNRESF